mmetsp:Transcript_152954/g.285009  ORF Transcript_152954/g.285009 Transcript_152954/m.285009 type:complete len:281 (+) Transcript_152954:90-932(+)
MLSLLQLAATRLGNDAENLVHLLVQLVHPIMDFEKLSVNSLRHGHDVLHRCRFTGSQIQEHLHELVESHFERLAIFKKEVLGCINQSIWIYAHTLKSIHGIGDVKDTLKFFPCQKAIGVFIQLSDDLAKLLLNLIDHDCFVFLCGNTIDDFAQYTYQHVHDCHGCYDDVQPCDNRTDPAALIHDRIDEISQIVEKSCIDHEADYGLADRRKVTIILMSFLQRCPLSQIHQCYGEDVRNYEQENRDVQDNRDCGDHALDHDHQLRKGAQHSDQSRQSCQAE